jgi:tellurite resistance protein
MLFIIFGSRGVTTTAKRGHFHCPQCDDRQRYAHRRVRRFFSLYFIPIIPLDLVGEYIECDRCRGTYDVAVLRYDPAVEGARVQAQFEAAVTRTMVRMMMADGVVAEDEVQTIRDIYSSITDREISKQGVHDEIRKAKQSRRTLAGELAQLAGSLNPEGKEIVIKAAFLVALADGELQDEERQLLVTIGQALGMTEAHIRKAIESLREEQ